MRFALILLLALLALANGSERKVAKRGASRAVHLPVDMVGMRPVTTRIRIGSPPRELVMLLDFQSDVSGVWSQDLLRTSHTFSLDVPVARDVFAIGPYHFMFQIQSVQNVLQLAARTGRPAPYFPPPVGGVDGWLALGPRSELRFVWNSLRVNKHQLTLWNWAAAKGANNNFLSSDERTFPNVPLKLHPLSAWWHRGFLVSPKLASVNIKGMSRSQHTADLEWLRQHHAENTTFVLFSNDSSTLLPERVYNSLFYGANVYHKGSVPREVRLAPGFRLPRSDWFHELAFAHIRWLDVGPLPVEIAAALVDEHPLPNCSAADLSILSLKTVLRRFEVVINGDVGELALIHTPVNDHLSGWQLALVVALIMLFIILFLVRSVFLKPLVYANGTAVRAYNATHYLTIGFRSQGFWFLMLTQLAAIALVLVAFWDSDKLPSMRTESGQAQLIYWVIAVFLHVSLAAAAINVVIQLVSRYPRHDLDEQQRLRARVFVITKGLLTQSLLLAVWIVLMDRTAIDTTNLAAALFSLIMLLFAIIDTLILLDRVCYSAPNPRVQLWPSAGAASGSAKTPRRTVVSFAGASSITSERVTLYYAIGVLLWLGAYMVWMFYFASTLQLYEMLVITMSTVTPWSLHVLCWSVVVYTAEYGVLIASTLSQVNHVSGS